MESLVNLVVRPPRAEYQASHLLGGAPPPEGGPAQFLLGGRRCMRRDFSVANPRGLSLECSWYEPHPDVRPTAKLPVVVYCHGNSGSRCDGNDTAYTLLMQNITVFTVDFSGSGRSGGDHVSLGWYEKADLATVIEYLRATCTVTKIGLWGRSMGAVTCILYGAEDPSIAGMVLDSPFASLEKLMHELVESQNYSIPSMFVSMAISLLRRSVKSKADFDITKLAPVNHAASCFIPALFCHATSEPGDAFILPHHSRDIYDKYAGDKNYVELEGDHNSVRPSFFFSSVSIFLSNVLTPPAVEGKRRSRTLPTSPRAAAAATQASSGLASGSGPGSEEAVPVESEGEGEVVSPRWAPPETPPLNLAIPEEWASIAASNEEEEAVMLIKALEASLLEDDRGGPEQPEAGADGPSPSEVPIEEAPGSSFSLGSGGTDDDGDGDGAPQAGAVPGPGIAVDAALVDGLAAGATVSEAIEAADKTPTN